MKFRKSFMLPRGLTIEVRKRSDWIFPKVRLETVEHKATPQGEAAVDKLLKAKGGGAPATVAEGRRRRKARMRMNAPPPPWSSRKKVLVVFAVIVATLFVTLPKLLDWADRPRTEG